MNHSLTPTVAPFQMPRVLVVEDDVLVRLSVADYLEQCGFKVVEAGSAAEAIKALESPLAKIDLVFSDIRMPGSLDGFDLAAWVRSNRPGTPVFLASGDIGNVDRAHEVAPGDVFFAKPYEVDVVAKRMRSALKELGIFISPA